MGIGILVVFMCGHGLRTSMYIVVDGRKAVYIPRLNSTLLSRPPLPQNCSSRDVADTACL